MKDQWLADLKIILCAVLALLAVVVGVLSLFSGQTALSVREEIVVSASPIDTYHDRFSCYLSGELFNPTDEEITIESLTVSVGDGHRHSPMPVEEIALEPITIPARCKHSIFLEWEDVYEWDRVITVKATVAGESLALENPEKSIQLSGLTVSSLVILVCSLALLIRYSKVRAYIAQEKRAQAAETAEANSEDTKTE